MTKKKLARKLRTPLELAKKVSIYDTKNWNNRKEKIAKRVKNIELKQKIAGAKIRAEKEKQKNLKNKLER